MKCALDKYDPTLLAKLMIDCGDYRSQSTIVRSIQRMQSGQTRVSGEMCVIATLLAQLENNKVTIDQIIERRVKKELADKLQKVLHD